MNIRVRGIYATALTKLFLSNGFVVTQPGSIIARRFSLEPSKAPADATVKDRDDKKGVVIIGRFEVVKSILELFRKTFPLSIFREYPYGIYDCYKGRIIGREGEYWKVEIEGGYGLLEYSSGLKEGQIVDVYVKKPFFDKPPILGLGIVISGRYARLMPHGRISFSRHIKSRKRREELYTLSTFFRREGWGIRWRSNANFGKLEDLMIELEELKKKGLQLSFCSEEELGLLCRGDAIAEVIFSLDDKARLDELRNQVVDTLKWHHYFKSIADFDSTVIDWIEYLLDCCDREKMSMKIWEKVHDYEKARREVTIEHERLNGESIYLRGLCEDIDDGILKVKRLILSNGIYDGLGVKKRRGDYVITYLVTGELLLPHFYYSKDGVFKGAYININLPIEVKSSQMFWYVDLGVDVVVTSNGEVKIIDIEEFEEAFERGLVSENLYNYIREAIDFLIEKLRGEKSPQGIYSVVESIFRRGGARARSKGADSGS